MAAVRLELIDVEKERDRVRAIWTRLLPPNASYFLSPGWVEAWLDLVPRDRLPRLAVATEQGRPVLAFFVGERRVLRHGFVVSRAWYLNATGHDEQDDLVMEDNQILGETPALQAFLDDLPAEWDELVLPALHRDRFPGNTAGQTASGYVISIEKERPSPFVDLEAVRRHEGGYPALISANSRSQLRRAQRGYEAVGPITLEVASDLDQAFAIYEELKQLHGVRWANEGSDGAFASAWFDEFHKRLIRTRFASGEIQLLRVRAGATTLGCLYNFVWAGRVHFYQSGLKREADNRLKPGFVCHAEAIVHNARAGHAIYDFLGGMTRYKHSLSTGATQLVWLRVQRPHLRFRVENGLREVKRKLVARRKKTPEE
jgi:CelD/BcsL family acetyltransferase involved in cellulose biosynthesis